MIKEILNRNFMLNSATNLDQYFADLIAKAPHSQEIRQFLETNRVDVADLEEAKATLQMSLALENGRLPENADEHSYFPRDAALSLAQSALQQYCEIKKPEAIVRPADGMQGLAETPTPVAAQSLHPAFVQALAGTNQGLVRQFELLDIGWANCLLALGVRNWRGLCPFKKEPADPFRIGDRARVVLFSDWGSGLPRAQKVATQIRRELLAAEAEGRDAHLIHLGDVYYSGWAEEYEKNVLPFWSVKEDEAERFSSWSLNANHDMYSGGRGYFEYLLGDVRFRPQQNSSFFSLENERWLLLGLDTGYHDNRVFDAHDLYGTQNQWAYEKLSAAPGKKGIVLSHHQPFSAYEKGGEKILDKMRPALDENLIRAWFWGHEHRCTLYEEREGIKYPRCIGHGGIPFYVETAHLPAGVAYEYRDGFDHLTESWNYFGFVVLDFADDQITARYVNERGHVHHTETIS